MNVKYQIFISSTYQDLKDERDQVIKAVLEMGHIPVGMEMFSAADEQQWEIIKRQVEQADYYVVLVAHRYGSVVEGVSFTEKEYDYAVQCGVPVLGFVIDDSAAWPHDRRDTGNDVHLKATKLISFKEKVKQKPVGFWKSAEDLHGKVSIALMKTFTAQPRTGWIPASQAATPQTTAELSRLSAENAQLRGELQALKERTVSTDEEEEFRPITQATEARSFEFCGSKRSLGDCFRLLAPLFKAGPNLTSVANHLIGVFDDLHVENVDPQEVLSLSRQIVRDLSALNLLQGEDTGIFRLSTAGERLYAFLWRRELLRAVQQPSKPPGNDEL